MEEASQRGAIYNGGSATVITQTTSGGSYFVTAFGINNSGRIVGQGIDPNNAARNVGIVYDMGAGSAVEVGALNGMNGALAFGVGNGGHVVGSSMLNQGSGQPFIWTSTGGIVAIPLATGTSQGSARAVNAAGWAVGNDSSAFSIPFLYDGTATFRLADLIPPGSGWDLSMNTSSSALGISDTNVIVGTGVFNGQTHAYAMVPALALSSAVSRKNHGAAGPFDVSLPGIESRSGGANRDYTIIITFSNNVSSGTAAVSNGMATLMGTPAFSGRTMTVNLTGVADVQTLTLSLNNVTDSFGQVLPSATIAASFLIGDVNNSGGVTSTDISQTKSLSGQPTNTANFRADFDASGSVGSTDIGQVKVNAGHALVP